MNLGFKATLTALHRGLLSFYDVRLLGESPMTNQHLSSTPTTADKPELRRRIKKLRQGISIQAQKQASHRLRDVLCKHPAFLSAESIAGYVAVNGEIDPQPLLQRALQLGKDIYLPVLIEDRMVFVRHDLKQHTLSHNRFGIPEPAYDQALELEPSALSLVLLPLLAFDGAGRRLGMGGGFYDRTFSFKRDRSPAARPLLFGLAHASQQIERVPVDNWDIPLAGVATDRTLLTVY